MWVVSLSFSFICFTESSTLCGMIEFQVSPGGHSIPSVVKETDKKEGRKEERERRRRRKRDKGCRIKEERIGTAVSWKLGRTCTDISVHQFDRRVNLPRVSEFHIPRESTSKLGGMHAVVRGV